MKALLTFLALGLLIGGVCRADDASLQGPYHKIIILGDSLTRHSPSPKLGWDGDRGMASTDTEKDYVHLFLAKLAQTQPNVQPDVWIAAEGGGKVTDKLAFADRITAFQADLAIVQLGENENADVDEAGFQQPYEQLLSTLRAGNPKVRIYCLGVWGYPLGSPYKDSLIKAACEKNNATFVDIRMVDADHDNTAAAENHYSNSGVAWHPGDRGMAAIAQALWDSYCGKPSPIESDPANPQPTLIEEVWSNPPSLSWHPALPLDSSATSSVAKFTADDPTKTYVYGTNLDLGSVRGRFLRITTRVKADSISAKPQPWNGVKLMLVTQDAESKKTYRQYPLPAGTFDWTNVEFIARVPDSVTQATLVVGLEDVKGTAWFDRIHIFAVTTPTPP